MSKKELFIRYMIFVIGLFFAGLGVAFSKHSHLGVSPISSVPNVVSMRFPVMTLGNWLIIWNCILILGQILILRREFKLYQLLQIPLSFLFGWFTDFGLWLVSPIPVNHYPLQLLSLACGIVILGFGISVSIIPDVIMNSGEALVKAISDKLHREFGLTKVFFDISCVLLSIILSLIFFGGHIQGTREGTIITACSTGFVVRNVTRVIKPAILRFIERQK